MIEAGMLVKIDFEGGGELGELEDLGGRRFLTAHVPEGPGWDSGVTPRVFQGETWLVEGDDNGHTVVIADPKWINTDNHRQLKCSKSYLRPMHPLEQLAAALDEEA